MAQHSAPLRRLVKASPDETLNLQGSEDPGFQMDYAPVEGMLHKYEMGLLYVVSTCSAHCRFCYREELIAQKEIERQDGTVAKKGLAKIPAVTEYALRLVLATQREADDAPAITRDYIRVGASPRGGQALLVGAPGSVQIALRKRPVDPERVEHMVSGIVRRLENMGDGDIKSQAIGRLVMEGLKNLDDVAYVRFASVYKNFREARDFEALLGELAGDEDIEGIKEVLPDEKES